MTKQELKREATALAANRLLPMILDQRRDSIQSTWRQAADTDQREQAWYAMRQLDELAGAIEDAIRDCTAD